MSRMPSKYSFSLWCRHVLMRGFRLCDSCRTASRMLRSSDAAAAVADETIEGARRVDLLRRRPRRRDPRQARAVDHRQPVFEPQLVRLDAEHEARDRGAIADGRRDHLIHRHADADLVGIEADRRARQQVHAAEMRAGRGEGRLVEQAADEDHVLPMRQHRHQARAQLHRRAAALRPPVRRLDAVGEEDDAQPQRRRRSTARGRLRRAPAATPSTAARARRRRRAGKRRPATGRNDGGLLMDCRSCRRSGRACGRRRLDIAPARLRN